MQKKSPEKSKREVIKEHNLISVKSASNFSTLLSISISVFGMGGAECQAVFVPSNELREALRPPVYQRSVPLLLNVFNSYSKPQKPKPGFNVVSIEGRRSIKSDERFSATFYCSTKSAYCRELTAALPGDNGELQSCHDYWFKKVIGLEDVAGWVGLSIRGMVKSKVFDPTIAWEIIGEKSQAWKPAKAVVDGGQLHITSDTGYEFSMTETNYIPVEYLAAIGDPQQGKRIQYDYMYMPKGALRTAARTDSAKTALTRECTAINNLFLAGDLQHCQLEFERNERGKKKWINVFDKEDSKC